MPTPNARLRRLRKRADLSLSDLAGRAGVSKVTVSRIENGHRHGDPATLRRLAAALGVHPEEIGGAAAEDVPA